METIAVELLMAFAGGTAGAAGQQAWQSLRGLVIRRHPEDGEEAGGRRELAALDQDPQSVERARALAQALAVRAGQDRAFGQRLGAWLREEAEPAWHGRTGAGDVHSEVSGTVHGPVVMGRDFNGTIDIG